MTTIIETGRLILRTWRKEDTDHCFQINQDPKVNELRGSLTMRQVKDFILSTNNEHDQNSYCIFASESKVTKEMIGFIGLKYIDWKPNLTDSVSIGWQLGSQYWGKGYATEGAKACLEYGFKKCGLKEIVSFTVPANVRSLRVMEKIGLKRDVNGDFAHPKLPADHPLSQHILYRLRADEYLHQAQETR